MEALGKSCERAGDALDNFAILYTHAPKLSPEEKRIKEICAIAERNLRIRASHLRVVQYDSTLPEKYPITY